MPDMTSAFSGAAAIARKPRWARVPAFGDPRASDVHDGACRSIKRYRRPPRDSQGFDVLAGACVRVPRPSTMARRDRRHAPERQPASGIRCSRRRVRTGTTAFNSGARHRRRRLKVEPAPRASMPAKNGCAGAPEPRIPRAGTARRFSPRRLASTPPFFPEIRRANSPTILQGIRSRLKLLRKPPSPPPLFPFPREAADGGALRAPRLLEPRLARAENLRHG